MKAEPVRVAALHGTYDSAFPLMKAVSPAMMVFLGVLTVGFAYEWRKGALEGE